MRRFEQYRDSSGAWTFDIADYAADLDAVTPGGATAEPTPANAYRMAVYLEGIIETHQRTDSWSDEACARFETFESTLEVEAVATALREIAETADT